MKNKTFIKANGLIILVILVVSSCVNNTEKKSGWNSSSANPIVSHAERFKLENKNGYTLLTIINPWQGAQEVNLIYNLVRRGSDVPAGLDSSSVIFVPVEKIICMSTTHVAMISALGEENSISGVSGTRYLYSDSLRIRVEQGLIADIGYDAGLNKELILKISPDLIMMYGIGSESAGYVGKIRELGVKVVFNADYLETDPLSKAEWIKLFGVLFCKEILADSIYHSEVRAYNDIKSYINQHITSRPKVLLGLPYKDTWYVSPGNSFISTLIGDAGGDYLWRNTESLISMPYGIENVYMGALTADYWLNIGSVSTKDEINNVDPRLADLPCFRNGNMYNNNNRIIVDGGNDYWESGSVYPHMILEDIATILHPDLFGKRELIFYRKVI